MITYIEINRRGAAAFYNVTTQTLFNASRDYYYASNKLFFITGRSVMLTESEQKKLMRMLKKYGLVTDINNVVEKGRLFDNEVVEEILQRGE